jgi:hypothetical protein
MEYSSRKMPKGWNAADRADARRYLYNMFWSSARDTPPNRFGGLPVNRSTGLGQLLAHDWQSLCARNPAAIEDETKKGPMATGHRAIIALQK